MYECVYSFYNLLFTISDEAATIPVELSTLIIDLRQCSP